MIFFNGEQIFKSGDQIGGRNYLLNSADFIKNWSPNNANNFKITDDTYLGGKIVMLKNIGNSTSNFSCILPPNLASQKVVWSCYAKADKFGDVLHTEPWGSHGLTNQLLTTSWQRYSFVGQIDQETLILFFWGPSTNKGNVYIALPKLELGSIATDWSPAPEDFLNIGKENNK